MGPTGLGDAGPDGPQVDVAVVGAQKCGTTTLAALLDQHPRLCLAAGKEAHLFDDARVQREGVQSADIERWWPHRQAGQLLLDATPSYLYLPGCIEALVRHNPQVRIIVILRPAAERAASHHDHERRHGNRRMPLGPALVAEGWRLRRDPEPLAVGSAHRTASFVDRGRYSRQLRRLFALSQHVHVTTLADLVHDTAGEMARMFEFLGLPPVVVSEAPRLNTGRRRRRLLMPIVLRAITGREMRRTAALLGWPPRRLSTERRRARA